MVKDDDGIGPSVLDETTPSKTAVETKSAASNVPVVVEGQISSMAKLTRLLVAQLQE